MKSEIWLGRFYGILAGTTALAGLLSYFFLPSGAVVFCFLGSALLACGFKLTEVLVGVLTKTRSANALAIVLIFTFKLGWWALVFWAARQVRGPVSLGVAAGLGAFLVALVTQGLLAAGWPKLSSHNKDS